MNNSSFLQIVNKQIKKVKYKQKSQNFIIRLINSMSKLSKPTRINASSEKIVKDESSQLKLNPKQKINFYLTTIQQKIVHEIDQHKQSVSLKKNPFFQNPIQKINRIDQEQLKRLMQQKKKTNIKLKQITQKQFQIKQKYKSHLKNAQLENQKQMLSNRGRQNIKLPLQNSLRNKSSQFSTLLIQQGHHQNEFLSQQDQSKQKSVKIHQAYRLRPKSQLSKQDIITLKTLKKQYNKFEQQAALKTIQHNEQLQKIRRQNQELNELIKRQQNIKKRMQIQQKLKVLGIQKLERQTQYEEERVKLIKLKTKPKKFQQLTKQFQEKEKQFQERKYHQMKERLKKKALDISQINEHQKTYQQIRDDSRRQIQEKYLEHSRYLQQSKIVPENISQFYKSVCKEQKQRKLEYKQKELKILQKTQRIKYYATKVYQQFAPRINTKEDNDQGKQQNPQKYVDKSLTEEQRKQLGNKYLKQMIKQSKQNKKIKTVSTDPASQSTNLPKLSNISTKYKDYLSETRPRYSSLEQRQQRLQLQSKKRYNNSISQVKKIMLQQYSSRNKFQTIEKIKNIAEKLEHNPNNRNYIEKIHAKLQILETIT